MRLSVQVHNKISEKHLHSLCQTAKQQKALLAFCNVTRIKVERKFVLKTLKTNAVNHYFTSHERNKNFFAKTLDIFKVSLAITAS